METVNLDGKQYTYVINYKHDEGRLNALGGLTQKVFGFDISDWYHSGYWGNNYVPHSLFDGDDIVSNISVSEIDFCHQGQQRKYIQLGTVMTSPEYRHKRLNRALMDKVLETWRGKCDLIYLFANHTVLDFYPKFGFRPVQEYQYTKSVRSEGSAKTPTKLDMTDKENQALVFDIACQAAPVAALSMQGNASLIMFWLTSFYSDLVYFSDEHQAVVVMQQEENRLLLLDVL